jgi:5-methylcytosine-specific restriction endonuclease McrA
MSKTKVCTKCGQEFLTTTEYFARECKSQDGFKSACKKCDSIYRKIHYLEQKYAIRKKQNIYHKRYNTENKEKISERKKEYYDANKTIILEKAKERGSAYREKAKEHRNIYMREYKKLNREVFNNYKQIRRARTRNLLSALTLEQWEKIKKDFNYNCCYCGENAPLEQEHFIPLSKNGEYAISNIIPSCKSCNSSKQDRTFSKWYPKQKFYNKQRETIILTYIKQNI